MQSMPVPPTLGGSVSRRLSSVRSHLQEPPPPTAAPSAATASIDERSVAFLLECVRSQVNVQEGEPCPGEVAVQKLVSARLTEIGCQVSDMHYTAEDLVLKDEFSDPSGVQAGERCVLMLF